MLTHRRTLDVISAHLFLALTALARPQTAAKDLLYLPEELLKVDISELACVRVERVAQIKPKHRPRKDDIDENVAELQEAIRK